MRIGIAMLIALSALPLFAQVQHAGIEGSVTDAIGLPITGATVILRDPATNQRWIATTDREGAFHIRVSPGTYDLHVEHAGFDAHDTPGIQLNIGRTMHLDVALRSAGATESVDVEARSSPLDTTETSSTAVIDTERIEELPVRSRSYLDFVLLTPGVVATQPRTSAARADSGFSFAGMRPRSNILTIDGVSNNDEVSGASRTELSLEAIQEFEVVTNGWSVENGGGAGGAINVLTRSGTNTIHGDAFLIGRAGDDHRERVGGALGGPIARDRTFFYTAGEGERSAAGGEVELSAKLNHQASARDLLIVRSALRDDERSDTRDSALTSTWTSIVGSSVTNDLRAQLARRSVSDERQTYVEAGDTAGVARDAHFLRAGADVIRTTVHDVDLDATRYGFFVEDQWTHASVSIDAGLRLDGLRLPQSLGVTSHQVTPRLGVAWSVDPRWIVRGGAGIFADRIPLAAFEARRVQPGRWNPSSEQASLGVEHAFAHDLIVSTTFTATRGMHLLHTAQRDDGLEVEPAASSRYRGLMLAVSQRLAEDAVWSVAYTVSRAMDDASDYDEVGSAWAPSRFDQRHRLVASARFEIEGRKIELAPILTIASGLPVDGASRNSARLPSSASLSLRVLKYVEVKPHGRLDFVAEAFNVLGRKTVEPSKRQIEFSLDVEF